MIIPEFDVFFEKIIFLAGKWAWPPHWLLTLNYLVPTDKRFSKVYDCSKATWKSINFELNRVNCKNYLNMQDPHISWPIFKEVLLKLCNKYVPKKTVRYQFQPLWFDTDSDKLLTEKYKWRAKAHSDSGTEENHEMFRKLRRKFKKVINEKMRLNVDLDESDTSLI